MMSVSFIINFALVSSTTTSDGELLPYENALFTLAMTLPDVQVIPERICPRHGEPFVGAQPIDTSSTSS